MFYRTTFFIESLISHLYPVDYSSIQETIRRHVQKVNITAMHYAFLKHTFTADKSQVRRLFPDMHESDFEALIEQLWTDKIITKDDGYTLTFEGAFARANWDKYF